MCGIFGCLNKSNNKDINIVKIIYNALSLLKNRGYDACGIFLKDYTNNVTSSNSELSTSYNDSSDNTDTSNTNTDTSNTDSNTS